MGKGALYPFSWAGSLQYAKRGCGQNGFTFCHSPFFVACIDGGMLLFLALLERLLEDGEHDAADDSTDED